MYKKQALRIFLSLLGVLMIGVSISFSRLANLGTDSFTTLNLGLSYFFDISYGTNSVFTNTIGLIFVFFLAKHLIGIGSLFNIFLVGYVADFGIFVITNQFGEWFPLWTRVLFGALGLLILSVGASIYIVAEKGLSPYDALPIIIEERSNGKISFQVARIATDLLSIFIGFSLGATIGVISIVSSFFMGPFIQFFRGKFAAVLENIESPQIEVENQNI